jgi:hypothetical protein
MPLKMLYYFEIKARFFRIFPKWNLRCVLISCYLPLSESMEKIIFLGEKVASLKEQWILGRVYCIFFQKFYRTIPFWKWGSS